MARTSALVSFALNSNKMWSRSAISTKGKKNGQRVGELGPEEFLAMREGLTMADASNAFDKASRDPRFDGTFELIQSGRSE